METRKVVIINNKTQSQKTIMSNANTLGELKAEARAAGVSIEGMTWYEGHLRAELKDDSAELPPTVMYRGTETTELTFLLTQPEKKVKSGAMSRAEAYAAIKSKGLADACKVKYGKNFTQCSTNDLIALIDDNLAVKESGPKQPCKCECASKPEPEELPKSKNTEGSVNKAFEMLVTALADNDIIDEEQHDSIMAALEGRKYKAPEKMSKKDIDDMFGFVYR